MAGYVVIIRKKTTDPDGYAAALEAYSAHANQSPLDKLTPIATRNTRFEVVEGDNIENVAMLKFPEYADALAWYTSDAYQRAIPHRQSVATFHAIVFEGKD
ncbi:DUF1330 domain-containing protein [Luteimonas sp. A537]